MAEWAHSVVSAAEAFEAGVDSLRTDSRARLNVAASLTIAEHLLQTWLTRWHGREPDVVVSLVAANSADTARLVLEGQADIGFVEGPAVPTGLSFRPRGVYPGMFDSGTSQALLVLQRGVPGFQGLSRDGGKPLEGGARWPELD